jgi:hypothetical protein
MGNKLLKKMFIYATGIQERVADKNTAREATAISIMSNYSDKPRRLFHDIISDSTLEKITKKKVLILKLMYCANTLQLSLTQSTLYTNASTMPLFTPVSCLFLNVPSSHNDTIYFDFGILESLKLDMS